MKPEEIISDEEVIRVHGYANFGDMSPREVVNDGVRKYAIGYSGGHTQLCILLEHKLITKPKPGRYGANLTVKGKRYARAVSENLRAALDAATARADAAEAERDRVAAEWAETSQRNYQRAKAAEAQAKTLRGAQKRKTFPILGERGASIDYQLVQDHGDQAQVNHYQSVERLAERGGLCWSELYAVLHNQKWQSMDKNEAMIACRALEARYLAALTPPKEPS